MKTNLKILLVTVILIATSCTINIDSDDDNCLECTYYDDGWRRTERVCADLGLETGMAEMRDRMQMEADSLGVTLNCKRN